MMARTKNEVLTRKNAALLSAASWFQNEQAIAKSLGNKGAPKGTLRQITTVAEKENPLLSGYLSSYIVRSNMEGIAPQILSPLHKVEPLIIEYCFQLSCMGSSLNKTQLMLLARSLVDGTEYSEKMITFKTARGLIVADENLLGRRWNLYFMKRNKDKDRTGRGKIIDAKRHTRCTYNAFLDILDMYECVYETMVEIGVCKVVSQPDMLDINVKVVESEEMMLVSKKTIC
jgi:hypothetical protein